MMKVVFYDLEMLLYRAGELYYLARFNQYFKKLGYWSTSEEEKETIKSL